MIGEMPKRRPDYWRSPAILSFLRRVGGVDPEVAVKSEAEKLITAANMVIPPFDPNKIAPLRRITSIQCSDSVSSSQLTPVTGGFIITVKRAAGSRDVFSLAHEIGHTFFYDTEPSTPVRLQRDMGGDAEEKLCDIFAAELLMPEQTFREDALRIFRDKGTWCETLFHLRSLYNVSMRAVTERTVELGIPDGRPVVIRWSWRSKINDRKDVKLRVDWSVPLKDGRHYFVWPGKPASENSPFMRASLEDEFIREKARLKLGALQGDFIVEAKGYHGKAIGSHKRISSASRSVLSIIWPTMDLQTKRDGS